MHVERFESKEAALKAAAAALTEILQQPGPMLLLLSAGSALNMLDYVNAEILSQRVTIGMIDERYDTDPHVNNFSQMFGLAFSRVAEARGAHFLDTRVQAGETLETFARRMETAWKDWMKQFPDGHIVATLGMGADGHTAGIMPYPENKILFKRLFEDVKQSVVGYDAQGKHQYRWRATATIPFLQTVDNCVVFVAGADKTAALARAVAGTGSLAETPARIWQDMRNTKIFTDIKE